MGTQKGYSLVELLVVIAIIALLGALAIPSYRNYSANQDLTQEVNNIKTNLRLQQNKAITGVNGSWINIVFYSDNTSLGTPSKRYDIYSVRNPLTCNIIGDKFFNDVSCTSNVTKEEVNIARGIHLKKIIRWDVNGVARDEVAQMEVRLAGNPNPNNALLEATNLIGGTYDIRRIELVFAKDALTKSLVIDGGNRSVGLKPSKIFVVDKN